VAVEQDARRGVEEPQERNPRAELVDEERIGAKAGQFGCEVEREDEV